MPLLASTPEAPKRASIFLRLSPSAPLMKRRIPFPPPSPLSSPHARGAPSPATIRLDYLSANFVTRSKLGSGCFGEVRLVTSKEMQLDFALKEFKVDKKKVRNGLNFTKRQLEEVRTHKSLPFHPNIVAYLQAWREDRTLYMLMELCETSLEGHWLKETTLSAHEISRVASDALQGLNHLAAFNIGHFDIKPANILRAASGAYKLADFTVARTLDKIDQDGGCSGDRRYLAPEVLEEQYTLKADVYSLGLTLAEIAVASSSPLTSDEWATLKNDQRLPARVGESLTADLIRKILQMIERDHHKRPTAADLLEGSRVDYEEFELHEQQIETTRLRLAKLRYRMSLSAADERRMRENRSSLICEPDDLVFDNDEHFFSMPVLMSRLSLEVRRRGALKFNLDD